MKPVYRPYVIRLFWVVVTSFLFAMTFNEISFILQKEDYDRQPRTIELVIPAGTADRVAEGEKVPGIPDDMVFVIGDMLKVRNEDRVDHQLGPLWVPPGASAQLILTEPDRYSYSCSFAPSQYLGLDVRTPTTFATRLTGLAIGTPTLATFLFLYSLLVFPIQPEEKLKGEVG